MTTSKPKTSSVRSGIISRIMNEGNLSIKNVFRAFILLSGFMLTSSLVRLGLFRYKMIRCFYVCIYFLGKRFTDSAKVRLLQKYIQPGAVVLDVGAAFGFYTLIFSKLADSDGQIIAFEPGPMYLPFLRDLIDKKELSNTKIALYAVYSEQARLDLHICRENPGENSLFRSPVHSNSVSVPAVSLDQYIDLPSINFIKIDVQGAEYHVIQGMQKIIRKNPSIVILLECSPSDLEAAGTNTERLLGVLHELGLRVFRCDTSPPSEVFKVSDLDYLHNLKFGQCDLICMR